MKSLPLLLVLLLGVLVAGMEPKAEDGADHCVESYGCNQGWCWSICNDGKQDEDYIKKVFQKGDLWCYTTRGQPNNRQRVRCNNKEDCDRCWYCANKCRA